MVSRKTYIFVILALLNACAPTITVNPPTTTSTSPSASVSTNNSPSPLSTVTPTSSGLVSAMPSPNPTVFQTPIAIISPTPTVTSTITPTPNPTPRVALSTLSVEELKQITDSSIVKSNNAFGINLYKDIAKEQKNENVFISPASLAIALQMTYNGAEGETKNEMTKALELGDTSLENVNNLSKILIKKLNSPAPDIQLQVANSIWGGKGRIEFLKDFKDNLTNYYNAQSAELEFSDPKAVDTINGWASSNTNGKIPKVIDKIDANIIAFIMNAVYFKANWTEKFDKNDTSNKEFTLADGTKKSVSMMSDFRGFRYFKNYAEYPQSLDPSLGFEGAELTYGEDKKVSLFIFLPDVQSSLEKFYLQLNEENLENWIRKFYYGDGFISFPKFKNEWKKELKNNLQNIGMKQGFERFDAQFKKMGVSPLGNIYIDFVLHNSFVDVNEEGTEAAAVTTVAPTAGSSPPPTRFVADRPFFYMIRDNETKSILFMGAVNDPKY